MRDIKFRAKPRFNGTIGSDQKWIQSSFFHLKKMNDGTIHGVNVGGTDCQLSTLGQYTGIKDKTGKEIYECDIVLYAPFKQQKGFVCEVIYSELHARYWLKRDDHNFHFEFSAFGSEEYEVIGNIYDNKDLLNG